MKLNIYRIPSTATVEPGLATIRAVKDGVEVLATSRREALQRFRGITHSRADIELPDIEFRGTARRPAIMTRAKQASTLPPSLWAKRMWRLSPYSTPVAAKAKMRDEAVAAQFT